MVRACLFAGALLAAMLPASAARAATVSVHSFHSAGKHEDAGVYTDGGTDYSLITFAALPGESNDLEVTYANGEFRFADSGPIATGRGCRQSLADASVAYCTSRVDGVSGIPLLDISLGDAGDRADVRASDLIRLDGGDGDDDLTGGSHWGHVYGGAGNDVVTGYGSDHIEGGAGDDRVYANPAGSYHSHLGGGEGNDVVTGSSGPDRLCAGDWQWENVNYEIPGGTVHTREWSCDPTSLDADLLIAGGAPEEGGSGDWLFGAAGADTLVGGAGRGGGVDAGDGDDSIDLSAAHGWGVAAGYGDDEIMTRNGGLDSLDCGGGADAVVRDPEDWDRTATCDSMDPPAEMPPGWSSGPPPGESPPAGESPPPAEGAPPAEGPAPQPPVSDRWSQAADTPALLFPRRARMGSRGRLRLTVGCQAGPCQGEMQGLLTVAVRRAQGAARRVSLRTARRTYRLADGRRQRLTLTVRRPLRDRLIARRARKWLIVEASSSPHAIVRSNRMRLLVPPATD